MAARVVAGRIHVIERRLTGDCRAQALDVSNDTSLRGEPAIALCSSSVPHWHCAEKILEWQTLRYFPASVPFFRAVRS